MKNPHLNTRLLLAVVILSAACSSVTTNGITPASVTPPRLADTESTVAVTDQATVTPTPTTMIMPHKASVTPILADEIKRTPFNPNRPTSQPGPTDMPEPTEEPARVPIPTAVPVGQDDPLVNELTGKGYKGGAQASVLGPDGNIYSVYKYTLWGMGSEIEYGNTKYTWVVAFYRWDGEQNVLLGTAYPSPYSPHRDVYPDWYPLMNWDIHTKNYPEVRALFKLNGITSDINGNGWPEITFEGNYCVVGCMMGSKLGYEIFEFQPGGRVVNLQADLPERINPFQYLTNPLVFRVYEEFPYGAFFESISLPHFLIWEGKKFVDVSDRYQDVIRADLEGVESSLRSAKSGHVQDESFQKHLMVILLWYQQIGDRLTGLNAFLELSDPARWPDLGPRPSCWLQIARARAQDQYARGQLFTITNSTEAMGVTPDAFKHSVGELTVSLDSKKYDLSACQKIVNP
jgi:hypothetical protein